ncbi:MAG: ribosomal-protein-alanine N-acetyltransferase [Chloroflexi bacterium]|nr:MAG: ribosomal-protein-alanine N-acetyltransferase [Chloroflexota bacterium]
MRLTDIPAVMAIERRAFPTAWSSGIYRRELTANPWSHYLVLRARKFALPPILAYGGVWQMDRSGHIPTLATHPDFRRKKLASYLLVHLLQLAQELGCTEATLEVRASNAAAQRLYLRHGFSYVGRRRGYYANPVEDALIMTRSDLRREQLAAELAAVEEAVRAVWLAAPADPEDTSG